MGDGTPDPVTSVAIRFGAETKVVALASPFVNPVMVGGHAFTIIGQADGSVIVGGLVNGASIATYTADEFNSLEVAYVSGNPFIITGFGTASVLSEPVSFNVPVEVVDADGDAASGNLGITLAPPEGDPLASVHIAASLLTEPNASSLVTIQFTEAVTGFDVSDLAASGGVLSGSFPPDRRRHLRSELYCNPKLRGHGAGDLDGGLHRPRCSIPASPGLPTRLTSIH